MQQTSLSNLEQHLDDLGLSSAIDNLIIHSSMISFGKADFNAEQLFEALLSKIAPDASIFVPTFTLNLGEEDIFDPQQTPSHGMGILPEYVRQLPDMVRALNPMHSYTGIGPNADTLKDASGTLSFGVNSCFEKLLALDPYLLMLGCPFHHGATHIHQQEVEIGVPYRLWVDLKRKVRTNAGDVEDIAFKYYGIDRAQDVQWSPIRVLEFMQKNKTVKELKLPYGKSYLMKLSDLDFASETILKQDNTALNIYHKSEG